MRVHQSEAGEGQELDGLESGCWRRSDDVGGGCGKDHVIGEGEESWWRGGHGVDEGEEGVADGVVK